MKQKTTIFIAALLVFTGAIPSVQAEEPASDQLEAIRNQQKQYIGQQGELEQQAELSEEGLKDAQGQLAKQQAVVVAATQKLEETSQKLQKAKKQRAVAMHESYVTDDQYSTLNALLGGGTLSQALSRSAYTNLLADKRFRTVDSIDDLIAELDRDRRDIVTKKNALEAENDYLTRRIAAIKDALANNRANLEAARAREAGLTSKIGLFGQNERAFIKNNEPVGDIITFAGSGTEHGLGMSQYGAKGFAEHGHNYRQILSHYYQGSSLGSVGSFQTNYGESEDYVARVVAGEINGSWPMETLKAQAIAARSYVYKNPQAQDCTPRTQACGSPNDRIRQAETKGEVLTYGGQVIQAFFHSTSGGWTENNENVWGGTPLPWLRGVPSPYETESPHWDWRTKSYTKDQMASILNQDSRTSVGALQTIKIVGRGVSGRVTSVQIVGTNGTVKTVSGPTFKSVFNNYSPADENGLRNTLFGFV